MAFLEEETVGSKATIQAGWGVLNVRTFTLVVYDVTGTGLNDNLVSHCQLHL